MKVSTAELQTMTAPVANMTKMIRRHTTADMINEVINDPSVYRWVRGPLEGKLDISPLVANISNFLLMGDHGGVLFYHHNPGLYEAHTSVLPAGRGKWTVRMVRAALHYMFTRTNAVEIVTRVPEGNLAALTLTRSIKGVFDHHKAQGWMIDGEMVPADIYALRIQDWMRDAPGLVERGKWFYMRLQQELSKHNYSLPVIDDESYFRYSGAAVEMMFGGQPHKACVFYNRYAAISGREPIRMVTENSAVIDIGAGILIKTRENDFWVVSCP